MTAVCGGGGTLQHRAAWLVGQSCPGCEWLSKKVLRICSSKPAASDRLVRLRTAMQAAQLLQQAQATSASQRCTHRQSWRSTKRRFCCGMAATGSCIAAVACRTSFAT